MINRIPDLKLSLILLLFFVWACQSSTENSTSSSVASTPEKDSLGFIQALNQHLNAVANKDLSTLATTFSPQEDMHLLLPQSEIMKTSQEFLDMHETWFADTPWTWVPTIVHTEIGQEYGSAIVDAMYREPDRAGKPYFHRMHITYILRNENGKWFVIHDHASSFQRTE